MATSTLTQVLPGVFTDASPAALVGTVYPPAGYASWEDFEDSFYPSWNPVEGKWEY